MCRHVKKIHKNKAIRSSVTFENVVWPYEFLGTAKNASYVSENARHCYKGSGSKTLRTGDSNKMHTCTQQVHWARERWLFYLKELFVAKESWVVFCLVGWFGLACFLFLFFFPGTAMCHLQQSEMHVNSHTILHHIFVSSFHLCTWFLKKILPLLANLTFL